MNIEQTKEAIRVMDASINGMEVESKLIGTYDWVLDKNPSWNWLNYDYRIKPTATLRPWTTDEVPLGAWMREIEDTSQRWLITNNQTTDHRHMWLITKEHSTDGGKTWLPCGVMEEAK